MEVPNERRFFHTPPDHQFFVFYHRHLIYDVYDATRLSYDIFFSIDHLFDLSQWKTGGIV